MHTVRGAQVGALEAQRTHMQDGQSHTTQSRKDRASLARWCVWVGCLAAAIVVAGCDTEDVTEGYNAPDSAANDLQIWDDTATDAPGGTDDAGGLQPDLQAKVECVTVADCADAGPCLVLSCASGQCVAAAKQQGVVCDDLNACTSGDACNSGGACVGAAVACTDGNACTDDGCDQKTGCVHVANGITCSGGDKCATWMCQGGVCKTTNPNACDDKNPCTTDTCGSAGCAYTPILDGPCDDADACTVAHACKFGSCTGVDLNCDDGQACTLDSCDHQLGCVHVNVLGKCSDGDNCTVNDACNDGVCIGAPKPCDDGDPCTIDTCNPQNAKCEATPAPLGVACDPQSKCVTSAVCTVAGCVGVSLSCDDQNDCTYDNCSAIAGCLHTNLPDDTTCGTAQLCAGGICQ